MIEFDDIKYENTDLNLVGLNILEALTVMYKVYKEHPDAIVDVECYDGEFYLYAQWTRPKTEEEKAADAEARAIGKRAVLARLKRTAEENGYLLVEKKNPCIEMLTE